MKPRKAAVVFIFITVMLDMLALGLIAPVLPKLILDFLGGDMKDAANWNGWFGLVFAKMQFFFAPVIGVLSGPLWAAACHLVIEPRGILPLDYIVMALSADDRLVISWPDNFRDHHVGSIPTAMAYIADAVPERKRAGAFDNRRSRLVSVSFSARPWAVRLEILVRVCHFGSRPDLA